jgi:hypothetical protein
MKIIKINTCADCPHCAKYQHNDAACKMIRTDDFWGIKKIPYYPTIPEWCPLEATGVEQEMIIQNLTNNVKQLLDKLNQQP